MKIHKINNKNELLKILTHVTAQVTSIESATYHHQSIA